MTNLEKLRLFIENAPPAVRVNSPVIGAKGDGFEICAVCLNRIQRRGCAIPQCSLIWDDAGVAVNCDLKEFHGREFNESQR